MALRTSEHILLYFISVRRTYDKRASPLSLLLKIKFDTASKKVMSDIWILDYEATNHSCTRPPPTGEDNIDYDPYGPKWYGDLYAVAPSRTLWDGHAQTNVFDLDGPQYHVEIRTSITAPHGVWYPCAMIIEDVEIIDQIDTASARNIVSATVLVEEGWCLYSQLREGQKWVVGSDIDGIRRWEAMEIDGEYRIITAWEIRNDTENLIELDELAMDNESDRDAWFAEDERLWTEAQEEMEQQRMLNQAMDLED